MRISTEQADEIKKVVLMRMPSPQHVMDSDQCTLELPFSTEGDQLSAEVPASGVPAPPGYYYLFINRKSDKGYVPSVARIVHVGSYSNDEEAIEPMPDTSFDGNGATPVEDNTLLNNPPNPNEPATVPGGSDGLLDTNGDGTVGRHCRAGSCRGCPAGRRSMRRTRPGSRRKACCLEG